MLFLRQQQQQQQKAPVLSLLLFYLLALCVVDNGVLVQAEEVNFVVLLPPTTSSDSGSTTAGYFPLAPGLESVVRLAVEHLNEDESLLDGDEVTLSLVPSLQATEAASGLCSAIATNTTVAAVSALGTFSASLLGSLSSRYLDLPILSVASSAARQEGSSTSGDGGFLFDIQPDIFPQMRALVRLILDMKTDRDALDGRSETTEKVWLVHTSDIYGSTAAAAFNAATKLISVPLVASGSDQTGSIFDDDTADVERATVEITSTTVVAASSQAVFDSEMATLVEEEASIIVLLAEGYDGAIVRTVLSQARGAGLTEGVQWYLPDSATMDHIFDRNSTYRDAELAFDMRGMLGVRACTPRTGVGSAEASSLLLEWQRLDPTEYPGAGAEGLTADGLMDPLLAFTYDAIFAAAAAVNEADEELQFQDGRNLSGISVDRCPFPVNGPWDNGTVVRDALVSTSSTLTGATGLLTLSLGAGEEDGDVDGRDVESVTFCAMNLRADATYGGRFQAIRTLDGATLDLEDGEGFKDVSATQGDQTFPAGGERYPYDRPLLKGRHLDVVMRRDAPPFVFVDGDGDTNADFTGITPSFIQTLSEMLEFTYTLSATPSGTVTPATIEMVQNGTVDMTGSWITITSDRAEFVAFTYPYFDLSLAFVYKPTLDEDVNLWKAFAPFEPRLWLALLIALLVTVFLLWLFEGAKNDQFSHGNWGKRRRNFTRGLSRSVYVTSSLMMTQLTHKPETLEGYLLTLGWLFSSFVLAASYTAELASYLTATRLESTDLTVNKLKNGEIPHSNVSERERERATVTNQP